MRNSRAQSILEYTIVVGIVTVLLYYMGTGVKRGVQSLVKVTADQVGNQQDADQDFNDTQQGYLVASNSATDESKSKQFIEAGWINANGNVEYVANTSFNEATTTTSNSITNSGFTESNN